MISDVISEPGLIQLIMHTTVELDQVIHNIAVKINV